ncbi:Methyl-accepting chemotaxis protein PctB [Rosistilla oblonga]|uniref:methyl-accepting chemotaxis protein n=1 Tax=Rosistilla oblonga TaxID=2527990 RepID=UPI001189591F|nr:methyl-accepting chemotaxis protein [Rosistilla oblonga]QDV14898.1 Methyl-accepting chemotaxis protein PctB [Rosistilla oblonga]
MLVACGAIYKLSSQNLAKMEQIAVADLKQKSSEKMVALREIKKQQIVGYFDSIRDQVLNFSADELVVEAMRDFREPFRRYAADCGYDLEIIDQLRNELATYYTREFGEQYRKRNDGKDPNVVAKLSQLKPASIALQYNYLHANQHPLGNKHLLNEVHDGTVYSEQHAKIHPIIRGYLEKFGYYDVFLCDSESGDIVYSAYKELDFSTSLIDGPYAKQNIGKVFQKANALQSADQFAVVDFEKYSPSYESPASFIASPIFDGQQKIGVAIFQLPIDRINQLMTMGTGMEPSCETYLVGPENRLRSDTRRDSKAHNVVSSFRNPERGAVKTAAIAAALNGKTDVEEVDGYLGDRVLSAYGPVDVLGLHWAIAAEVARDEAFAAADGMAAHTAAAKMELFSWSAALAGVAAIGIAAIALLLSHRLVAPINRSVAMLRDIAEGEGDLTKRLDATRRDELGELAKWFNLFAGKLQSIIGSVTQNATTLNEASAELTATSNNLSEGATRATSQSSTVAAAAEELSANMTHMARSTEEVSGNVQTVSTAVNEMNQTIVEVAQSAERSASIAGQAAHLVEHSNDKISELGLAADEIGKVIQVIQDIAEQTNLLALNATIEAARAGEAGKGFAVVATEVKELAKQTAIATDDIRHRIEGIQGSTGDAVKAIREISDVINSVNEASMTIASAVEQQSMATKQISDNVSQTAQTAAAVARSVQESATASREITQNITSVDSVLRQTTDSADNTRRAGDEFSNLAHQLSQLVGQFKTGDESDRHDHSTLAC